MSQAKPNVNIVNAQGIIQSMQLAFEQMNSILKIYGINMYIYKVKLYRKEGEKHIAIDDDCEDASKCIDYIVRIKCDSEAICEKLKESIKSGQ